MIVVGRCPTCAEVVEYVERFDAYWCHRCAVWTEERCSDDSCRYCARRPEVYVRPARRERPQAS